MDFDKRLTRAIERGQHLRNAQAREDADKAMTEEDLRNLHSQCRLEISEHIDNCLERLGDHFLGFQFQTIVREDGWGAKINRDDIGLSDSGKADNFYSRLEMVVKPFGSSQIIELTAKGTIRNKEILTRSHYQFLRQVDVDSFKELIDLWVLEFAENYSARS